MSARNITAERLLALIETYGADVDAYPEDERDSARALLTAEPQTFAAALEEARSLDMLLQAVPAVDTPADLRARLIDSAPKPAKAVGRRWRLPVWIPAGAIASLSLGLFAGMSVAQTSTPAQEDQAQQLVYAALGFDTYSMDLEDEAPQ